MRKLQRLLAGALLLAALLLTGCFGAPGAPAPEATRAPVQKEEPASINGATLREDKSVYEKDDDGSVVTMYLTVSRGNRAENTDHAWTDVIGHSIYYYEELGIDRYSCEALLQIGDDTGPVEGEFGYTHKTPNATVRTRGATTSSSPQKSIRITIREDRGEWNGQRTIALNKHPYDEMRFTNKLCYDYIKQIPDMIGLRTQFVHLYVRDLTGSDASAEPVFVDYGLFTQVEQPNNTFLRSHGLSTACHLYKANYFEFYEYDAVRLATDPAYNLTEFEQYLEVKGDTDHKKLLSMVAAVNDYATPIEETFDRYFDEENYFTWMAYSILVGNIDSQTRNYYLYSPLNSDTWYFICWDCDWAFNRYTRMNVLKTGEETGWEDGVANYWGVVLHNRVLKIDRYRALLDQKIEELRAFMTPERTREMIETYAPVIERYSFAMPDRMHLRVTEAQWEEIFLQLPYEVERNYALYRESLVSPMPFYLDDVRVTADGLHFEWGASYCFDGSDVTYLFELGRDYLFNEPVVRREGIRIPEEDTALLEPGQYFYRVRAINEAGQEQFGFDYYVDLDYYKHFGTRMFYVNADGSVTMGA